MFNIRHVQVDTDGVFIYKDFIRKHFIQIW